MLKLRSRLSRAACVPAAVLPLLLAAPAAGGSPPGDVAQAEARELYASTCVSCHGPAGRGDGLAAAGLPAKPASFADPAWQKATTDQQIERAIVGGGAAIGKSPLMPPNPALRDRPAVLAALLDLIRGFAAGAGPAAR